MTRALPLAFALIISLAQAPSLIACLNVGEAESRRLTIIDQFEEARALAHTMETPTEAFHVSDAARFAEGSAYRLEADAIARIFAGRPSDAVELLRKAEQLSPGQYSIAANLGTAYELAGLDEEARAWIAESLRRNPDSHSKTEWIHLLILDAKLRRASGSSPAALAPLIPLPADFSDHTLVQIGSETRPVSEIKRSIAYQLRERMKFVKPRDPYVADLLFTMSRIDGRLYGPRSAYEYVKLADAYGYSDTDTLNAARDTYFWPVVRGRIARVAGAFFEFFAIACLIIVPLWWIFRLLQRRGYLEFSVR